MTDRAGGPEMGPELAAERARALLDLGRYREAEAVLRAGLQAEPDNADLVAALAFCRLRLNDHKGSYDLANRALGLEPEHPWALRLQAFGGMVAGHYKRAHAGFTRALALEPSATTFLNRAQCLALWAANRRVGRAEHRQAALDDIDRALALEPENAEAYTAAARIFLTRPVEPARAEQAARAALAIDADHGEAHELLGQVFERRGRLSAAADEYVLAGRAEPTDRGPTARLRRLGARPTLVGPVAVLGIIRLVVVGRTSGWPAYLAAALVAAGLALWVFLDRRRRQRVREELSPAARTAIEVSEATAQPAYRLRRRRW
ncbi:MAG: tetratricopeptide repeat protein [Acidimicrobiales bacterium]